MAPHSRGKAVCLLSGGLDSSTCLALARREGYECYALSFDYGQRHRVELEAAARVAAGIGRGAARGGAHRPATRSADSALTDDIAVPKGRSAQDMCARHSDHLRAGAQHHLPFVRAGLGRGAGSAGHLHRRECARLLRLSGLPPGVHRGLSSAWPTWPPRPASKAARGIAIHTPLIRLIKAEIVKLGARAGRAISASPTVATIRTRRAGRAAHATPACCARKGFEEAGIEDR